MLPPSPATIIHCAIKTVSRADSEINSYEKVFSELFCNLSLLKVCPLACLPWEISARQQGLILVLLGWTKWCPGRGSLAAANPPMGWSRGHSTESLAYLQAAQTKGLNSCSTGKTKWVQWKPPFHHRSEEIPDNSSNRTLQKSPVMGPGGEGGEEAPSLALLLSDVCVFADCCSENHRVGYRVSTWKSPIP